MAEDWGKVGRLRWTALDATTRVYWLVLRSELTPGISADLNGTPGVKSCELNQAEGELKLGVDHVAHWETVDRKLARYFPV
jgi:hypothetical protein